MYFTKVKLKILMPTCCGVPRNLELISNAKCLYGRDMTLKPTAFIRGFQTAESKFGDSL